MTKNIYPALDINKIYLTSDKPITVDLSLVKMESVNSFIPSFVKKLKIIISKALKNDRKIVFTIKSTIDLNDMLLRIWTLNKTIDLYQGLKHEINIIGCDGKVKKFYTVKNTQLV